MSTVVARIGEALSYDAAEYALAHGATLADVLELVSDVCGRVHETDTSTSESPTARPGRAA